MHVCLTSWPNVANYNFFLFFKLCDLHLKIFLLIFYPSPLLVISFNDCLYLSGSAWMLASSSLILCLPTFFCRLLYSFFLLHAVSLLWPPPSFTFPPTWLTVFVSLCLNFAHLLCALMDGDIWRAAPSAAHGAGVAAAHLADGGMQSCEIFVEQRDYMITAPRRHSRRSL